MSCKRKRLGAVDLPPPPPLASMDLVLGDSGLLTEIFLRLPAKPLIRFKSVCREWATLVSSDHFCHRHTLRRPKLQPSLILQMYNLKFFYWNQFHPINDKNLIIPYSLNVPQHQIVQESNGLMLLEFEPDRSNHYGTNPTLKELKRNPKTSYYVYNPTTRKSRKIRLNNSDKYPCVAAVNLAFDPSKSPYYKVVCVRCTEESYKDSSYSGVLTHQIEVYDSESHTWNFTEEIYIGIPISNGVHWKNTIYWWMSCDGGVFLCYDIATSDMKVLSSPKDVYPEGHDSFPQFQVLDGHLYHFDILETETGRVSVALWELKDDDDDDDPWLFKCLNAMNNEDATPLRLLGGSEGCTLLTQQNSKIRAYNLPDKSCEDLVDLTSHPYRPPYYHRMYEEMKAFLFGETLALV